MKAHQKSTYFLNAPRMSPNCSIMSCWLVLYSHSLSVKHLWNTQTYPLYAQTDPLNTKKFILPHSEYRQKNGSFLTLHTWLKWVSSLLSRFTYIPLNNNLKVPFSRSFISYMQKNHMNFVWNKKMCPWNTDAPVGTQVNGQTDREIGTVCNRKFEALI